MSIAAMRSGLHVYCEKPAAGSYQEALRMLGASVQYQRRLAIGFQNVATASIQRIKELRIAGRLGALRSARTRVLWPRSAEYYARNAWAGKLMVDGKSIYDSPMQNATSHFLQNMLYVAGASPNETASPVRIYAENYRAHQIQSADTQFLRLHTAEGVEIVFATTHACSSQKHPVTEYRFEGGRIEWDMEGTTRLYEDGAAEPSESWDNNGVEVHYASFLDFFASLTEDREPVASIGNSLAQVFVVENAFASSGRVVPVGPDHRSIDSNRGLVSIDGIEDAVERAYVEGESFFEQGLPWARQSRTLDVSMS
jgi:predicted dehydrogenase